MKTQTLVLIVCSALLAGCSAPGMNELIAYCRKDAEDWTSDKVYADGFFSDYDGDPNITLIVLDGYEFLEVYKSKYEIYDDIKETGYIKVYKARRDSGLCDSSFDRKIQKQSINFYESFCIASEVIDYPESRYWVSSKSDKHQLDNIDNSIIYRFETEVVDTRLAKPIAKRVTYGLAPWPNSALSYGIKYRCRDLGFVSTNTAVESVISSRKSTNNE